MKGRTSLGRRLRLLQLLLLAVGCWGSSGCAEDSEPIAVCDGHSCPKSCTKLKGSSCDILLPSCRERIFKAVECVRGTPGELPEVRLLSEDQVRTEWESRRAAAAVEDEAAPWNGDAGTSWDGGDGAVVPTPHGLEVQDHWERALFMLGLRLSTPAMDEVDVLGGVYEPATRGIILVDRGEPQDSPGKQTTLAHELVHALQDQSVGLVEARRGRTGTTDASLAMGCLIEGEAVLYEELSWGLLQGLNVDRTYWDRIFENRTKYSRDAVASADSPYDMTWRLRYGIGARYLADAWLAGGSAEVSRFYDAAPASTVHWMHGYADAQQREMPLILPLQCVLATPPAAFERVSSDVFGALVVFAFLAHNLVMEQIVPSELSWQRALGWRQDRVEVFANEAGETAVSWRIRFADEQSAAAIESELTGQQRLALRVLRHGSELELLVADGMALATWSGTDPGNCPPVE